MDADFFIVHARHGGQTYAEKADWSVYSECCETGKRLIANGDVKTKANVEILKTYGISGVMVGREAIKNPAVFNMLKGLHVPSISEIAEEYLTISNRDDAFRYRKNVLKHLGQEITMSDYELK